MDTLNHSAEFLEKIDSQAIPSSVSSAGLFNTKNLFSEYLNQPALFDEYIASFRNSDPSIKKIIQFFNRLYPKDFIKRQALADHYFKSGGVTFSVYSNEQGSEKIFPFDLIPRIISQKDWLKLERGIQQRIQALNAFLNDIYHEQHIIKDNIIPADLVFTSNGYFKSVKGIRPKGGIYIHVAGIDIVRDKQGNFLVLEDNLRIPSGISYVIANRWVSKQVLQSLLNQVSIQAVDDYPMQLRSALLSLLPTMEEDPLAVVLTPGHFNSAYFEHGFLAQQMGFKLVEGQDLFVEDRKVYAKTTQGPKQVHVIYKRVDDAFLDPYVFRKNSLLGIPGLISAYEAGHVILANAVGNGIADDKAIFNYVPNMIRYYLSEEPLLSQVPTYLCADRKTCQYVLQNLDQLIVKVVDGSGGYGMLFGPQAGARERAQMAEAIYKNPRDFIAQPMVELSTCPTLIQSFENKFSIGARHVDLRPYAVMGTSSTWVLPGGLTRVALKSGSYIVNSSQGGGSKDTWIVRDDNK